VAVLTDDGWDVVVAVAPGHVDAVRETVFGPLTAEQTRVLGDALQAIVEKLDPDHSQRVAHGGDATG
jgi:sulfate adenylyltransferase subunit 1 (EFTu-like GTPase family)